MALQKDIYCFRCGHRKVERPSTTFNEETGRKDKELVCVNLRCYFGCHNTGGHDLKTSHKYALFGHQVCTKCGTENPGGVF